MLQRRHSHLDVRKLDYRQVYGAYIFHVLIPYCGHVHSHDFLWLLFVSCSTLLSYTYEKTKSTSNLLYDWRFTENQFTLASSPLRLGKKLFLQLNPCGNSPSVTSFLTIWVCLWWMCLAFRQAYISHIWHAIENTSFCTARNSSASTDFTEQIMPNLCILCYHAQLSHLNGRKFDHCEVWASCIFCVWLHLVIYREPVHAHDFVWLLFVACTILLYNRIHMGGWKLCANRGPLGTLENFQWYAGPCYAGAVTNFQEGQTQVITDVKSQIQSHIATDGWSVSIFFYLVGWDLAPIRSLCRSPRFV
jgi:hypothetical protein